MGIAMPGIRSSNPSIPAVTGLESPLIRPRYRDWSHAGTGASRSPEWLTRLVNLTLALLALIVLLPAMVLLGLMVRVTSRGPVLYTQVRVGYDRRHSVAAAQNHRRQRDL